MSDTPSRNQDAATPLANPTADPHGMTRREWLGTAGVAAATLAAGVGTASAQPNASTANGAGRDRPRNIIFLVSDGMGMAVPQLAEAASFRARGRGTAWVQLMRSPDATHGFFDCASLNSPVTDSAAASSAWGSGSRVFNSSLNVLPDGVRLTPIGPLVRDSGRRFGLVTTTRVTHATPAGFTVANPDRNAEDQIARQFAGQVDLLMGGGRRHFPDDTLAAHREAAGSLIHTTHARDLKDDRATADPERPLLGLFSDSHLPFYLDRRTHPDIAAGVPTLATMTRLAIRRLAAAAGDQGFFLQVEGGRVDHAAHGNDAAAMIWDQLEFDDAVRAALDWAGQHPETLVVVTTDHGNANPALNGMGGGYADSDVTFNHVMNARSSFEHLAARIGQAPAAAAASPDAFVRITKLGELVEDHLGVRLDDDELTLLAAVQLGEKPPEVNRQHRSFQGLLAQMLGNRTGIQWTGNSHTADYVVLTAKGPGAEAFQGLLRNTDAFTRICELWRITHRNPAMTPAEAERYAVAAPRPEIAAEHV